MQVQLKAVRTSSIRASPCINLTPQVSFLSSPLTSFTASSSHSSSSFPSSPPSFLHYLTLHPSLLFFLSTPRFAHIYLFSFPFLSPTSLPIHVHLYLLSLFITSSFPFLPYLLFSFNLFSLSSTSFPSLLPTLSPPPFFFPFTLLPTFLHYLYFLPL